jgi:hypothetical protein
MAEIPNVLSIAGSDPSGGAGVQADLKTFAALGCYGMAAITALTAQNTRGVTGVHLPDAAFVAKQINAIFDDIRVDAVKIGTMIEPWLLDSYESELGPILNRGSEVGTADGLIVATLDGQLESGEPVEAKTAGIVGPTREWVGVPDNYYWQLQTQMHVCEVSVGHLVALLGGRGRVRFTVPIDAGIVDTIEQVKEWFLRHVAFDEEPTRTLEAAPVIRRMDPVPGTSVQLGEEMVALVEEYQDLNASNRKCDKRKDEIQAEFILAIGTNEIGILPCGEVVTFKSVNAKGYTVEPKTYRKLLLPRRAK